MKPFSQYRHKIMSAERAVELVRSGDRLWFGEGNGTPEPLITALLRRANELRNVEIVHMLTLGTADYTLPEYEGHFRHNGLFLGHNVRPAVAAGRADYTPIYLSEIERLFWSGEMPLDVAFIQTSPPDEYGYLSLGTSIDCSLSAAQCARLVIAEVNDQMPRTLGDTFLHVSKVTAIVETSRPLLELPPVPVDDVQHRIAQNVAPLIPDGATLQLGIGGIPNAVLEALRDRNDLGVHSEMCPDGVVPLMEAGVITGDRKTLHRGKAVAGFVLGTRRIFEFIDNNPIFEFHPTQYVNDPFVIAQNERMVAINSAIQVDLTGQVCADSIGTTPFSGFGGQLDFIRGSARSKGGKPIIALPSTARHGAVSRIVPVLDPGAGVVTSRGDVHYVVTEHGVAYLWGKTLRQRAEALIAIADPRFRDELYDFAARTHYLERSGPKPEPEFSPAHLAPVEVA
ncbi:MAG TPA: acetyl-CoA hydrolase/transferase C-terminal domain-containing protein [Bryobacteraceae bacterium]|nr:acetyl-CoA hydrolase/transferase C-terminal domain-containing protein [Bryobacteraceae bacterium]